MKEKFVKPNDSILVQITEEIRPEEIKSPEIEAIIERMLNAAYGKQVDRAKPLLVGLAAPQIGIPKRVILIDVSARGKGNVGDLRVYINPEIVWKSEEESEWYEGCYSTDRVCGIVSRPNSIKVKALTRDGQPIEEKHEGYTARIFQHEIDHLNGIEFVSYITDDNKLHWVEEDEFPEYRNNEGWRNWPKKCPREKWERIKGISKQ
ncbi:MAG: Peptide deformylase [Candidatus Levybacteria bacterium GW2011_GWB1_39_7]|nr:MAG: Peptide deformylase [Candidatus Levybacteria bacterium GW2011_GWA1_39_11]KKR25231.1 MAG: Peptide deformylase [Candidatus Levybacteria bacterium GW2011_GWB1_39_7]KKR27509.1 MAG: Peptide deformylase [Microgenomates group bacterium GW2011_GWC1_39_7]OGH45339.1 MAG: peptide deformylase [Candidatus Levybacteria bacterium RIFCSPLOWO2_02_FULL_39_26]OGH48410.1 MAG: peptide deformylase [Candidatus Levybacteria bacterium RIFCSPLOWO2_12_FULL_39_17]